MVKDSGLFDEAYYCNTYPEIRGAHLDPLLHYLETGGAELRNPSKTFDARHYVELCRKRGEQVDNPLVHYLEVGAAQGLTPHPSKTAQKNVRVKNGNALKVATPDSSEILLTLDRVEIELRHRGTCLIGSGWCLSASPIAELEVKLGDIRVHAHYGLARADVASSFPHVANAGNCGFEFMLEPLPAEMSGVRELVLMGRTLTGVVTSRSFEIDLVALRTACEAKIAARQPVLGPGSAGRPMELYVDTAEVDGTGLLHVLGWAVCVEPIISVMVLLDDEKIGLADYGQARDDVGVTHAKYPNARFSGFSLHADISASKVGEREVKVRSATATGISREVIWPVKLKRVPHSRPQRKEQPKLHYYCDFVEVTTGGQVAVIGWTLGVGPTEQILVLLDGQELGDAEIGIERSDVGNSFPAITHALRAG